MNSLPFDPYHRPTDRVSVVEEKIAIAAFSAFGLLSTVQGRAVPLIIGSPILIAANDMSSVLVVAFQANNFIAMTGRFAGHSSSLVSGSAIEFASITQPAPQILLPKERLWVQIDLAVGATSLIVVEVTP